MTQRCRHLAELSVNSQQLTPRGIIAAMMRASKLQRLCVCGNRHLQVSIALPICSSVRPSVCRLSVPGNYKCYDKRQ